jgi:hypothetical protein
VNQEQHTGGRRQGWARNASIYRVLLDSLEPQDRQWVIDIVARERQAELEGDLSGEAHPRALW